MDVMQPRKMKIEKGPLVGYEFIEKSKGKPFEQAQIGQYHTIMEVHDS